MLLQHSTLLNSENAAAAAASLNMCCWGFILHTTSSTLRFIQPIDQIQNIIYNNNIEHALSPGSHIERENRDCYLERVMRELLKKYNSLLTSFSAAQPKQLCFCVSAAPNERFSCK